MKKLNLFSNLWRLLRGSRKDDGSTRYRLVIDSLSTRYRVWQYSLGKIAAVVCMLLTIGSGNVWGAEDDTAYTLTCTQNSSNTTYANSYNVTINSKNWSAPGNQNAGSGWRVGGAKGTNVSRYITGKSTIDKPIKKITVNHNGRSNANLTINSFSVTVSKNSDFSSPIETKTVTSPSVSSAGSFDLTPTSSPWPSGCYYKFTLVYTHSKSSNYGLDLTSLVFVEGASGGGSTCATPTFSPAAGTYCGSQSVTISSTTTGSTIYYTTDNSTPTTSSSHGTAGAASATITVSSSQTLKAIAVKDGMSNSATGSAAYTINNIANTQETAYTVAEARDLIDANVCLTQQVYVKGYVSAIVTAYNGTYGNISFNITDNSDGTGDTFQFYRNFKGSGNTKWTSAAEAPQVGNYVVGYGTLTKYSSTYELAAGNYCVVNSSYTITAVSNNDSYGTVSLTGKVITATPESGYRVSTTTAYTVTSGTATVTDNGDGTFTVTPSSDCTVRINFEALPTYTVTLMDDGDTRTQASGGASVTLPSRAGCSGYTFAGWTKSWTEEQDEWTTTAPSIIPAGSYTPTANENLYPVYTKTEGGGSATTHTLTKANTSWSGYVSSTQDDDQSATWSYYAAGTNESGTYYWGLNSHTDNHNIGSPTFSGNVTSIKAYIVNSSTTKTRNVYICSSNSVAQPTSGDLGSQTIEESNDGEVTITTSGTFNQFYIYVSDALKFKYIQVTVGGSTTSYISVPNCCDKNVTLSDPSITDAASSGATITFDQESPVPTCAGETEVQATLTLPAGYQATALSFTGGSVSVEPTISTPVTSTTTYTLTFAQNTNATLTTTATIAAKPLNSITLGETEVEIYDQQYALIDVEYDPADILTKGYSLVSSPTKVVTTGSTNAQLKVSATKAGVVISSVTNETVSIKATADNTKTASVAVTINPLPRVHFVDIVHGIAFADVVATIEDNEFVKDQPTPTYDDISAPGSSNTCENTHLHLIGWIDSTWSGVVNYLNNTASAPNTAAITGASGYYYAVGANIDTDAKDGKTYYAVWAVEVVD